MSQFKFQRRFQFSFIFDNWHLNNHITMSFYMGLALEETKFIKTTCICTKVV